MMRRRDLTQSARPNAMERAIRKLSRRTRQLERAPVRIPPTPVVVPVLPLTPETAGDDPLGITVTEWSQGDPFPDNAVLFLYVFSDWLGSGSDGGHTVTPVNAFATLLDSFATVVKDNATTNNDFHTTHNLYAVRPTAPSPDVTASFSSGGAIGVMAYPNATGSVDIISNVSATVGWVPGDSNIALDVSLGASGGDTGLFMYLHDMQCAQAMSAGSLPTAVHHDPISDDGFTSLPISTGTDNGPSGAGYKVDGDIASYVFDITAALTNSFHASNPSTWSVAGCVFRFTP